MLQYRVDNEAAELRESPLVHPDRFLVLAHLTLGEEDTTFGLLLHVCFEEELVRKQNDNSRELKEIVENDNVVILADFPQKLELAQDFLDLLVLGFGERSFGLGFRGPRSDLELGEQCGLELRELGNERIFRLELVLVNGFLELHERDIVVLVRCIVHHVVVVKIETDCRLHGLDHHRGQLDEVEQLDCQTLNRNLLGQAFRRQRLLPRRQLLLNVGLLQQPHGFRVFHVAITAPVVNALLDLQEYESFFFDVVGFTKEF